MAFIPAFALGAITVAQFARQPNIWISWARDKGTINPACMGDINTSRLINLKDDYEVVLICGPLDPTVDKMTDSRAHISIPFKITGAVLPIRSGLTEQERIEFDKYTFWWFRIAIIPEGRDMRKIKSLTDILNNRGRFLDVENMVSDR
jgi:hypothetical protein